MEIILIRISGHFPNFLSPSYNNDSEAFKKKILDVFVQNGVI